MSSSSSGCESRIFRPITVFLELEKFQIGLFFGSFEQCFFSVHLLAFRGKSAPALSPTVCLTFELFGGSASSTRINGVAISIERRTYSLKESLACRAFLFVRAILVLLIRTATTSRCFFIEISSTHYPLYSVLRRNQFVITY